MTSVPYHRETIQLIYIAKSIDWFLYDGEYWSLTFIESDLKIRILKIQTFSEAPTNYISP